MAHGKALLAGVLGVAAFVLFRRTAAPAAGPLGNPPPVDVVDMVSGGGAEEVQQVYPPYDVWMLAQNIGEALYSVTHSDVVNIDMYTKNEKAFLAMIRYAEGTSGPNGYRTLFGGDLFDNSFVDHPRFAKRFTNKDGQLLWTTAAGAYQFMAASPLPNGGSTKVDTWGTVKKRLNLPDFSPASQDKAALYLIDEAGALADVRSGRFDTAVSKVRRIWASLPGAGYSQPEKTLQQLAQVYAQAGGAFA